MPNAAVGVTGLEHGQVFATTTNRPGEYVASALRVGR
jgi:hypothetical protein